jgi:hypothetical protein
MVLGGRRESWRGASGGWAVRGTQNQRPNPRPTDVAGGLSRSAAQIASRSAPSACPHPPALHRAVAGLSREPWERTRHLRPLPGGREAAVRVVATRFLKLTARAPRSNRPHSHITMLTHRHCPTRLAPSAPRHGNRRHEPRGVPPTAAGTW